MARARGRLDWVEAGRGLAACMVMVSHAYVVRPLPIDAEMTDQLGVIGVGFFFVLSGFIMMHVHGDDIGRPDTVAPFAWRRLVRIWPTYWLVLAIAFGVNQLQRPAARVHPDLRWIGRQLLIWPGAPPFLGPAWTLRHELLFYALFGLVLASRRVGLVVLSAWTIMLVGVLMRSGMPSGPVITWAGLLLHPLNLSFPIGMALGWAVRMGWGGRFAGGAGIFGCMLLLLSDPCATAIGSAFCYAGLLGLLVELPTGARWPGPSLVWLGAVSYSLYLLHLSIFTLLRGGLDHVPAMDPSWSLRLIGQMAVALLAAGLFHSALERPLLRRLTGWRTVFGIPIGRPAPIEVAARA